MNTRIATGLVLLLAAYVTLAARADELLTLSGKKLVGTLVAVDAQTVTFADTASGANAQVPVKDIQLVDLKFPAISITDATERDEIELTDGSLIVCSQFRIKGKKVEPTLLAGPNGAETPTIDLPLGNLFAVQRGAGDPKARVEWKKLVASRGKRDLFVIKQAEGLNPLPGTVLEGSETGEAITFEREDGQRSTLKLARASGGLVFNQPPRDVIPPTVCKVRDAFGNVLFAQSVALAGTGLTVKTVSGATFSYPTLKGVSKLDFAEGNVAFLSDLTPTVDAPAATPDDPHFTFLNDRTPEGATLRLDSATYAKGVWIYPETVLTYKLNADYREFKTVIGVDDRVPVANGSVRVVIEGDGRVLFTGSISRKEKPKPLTLDVKNVKELRIVTERESLYLGGQLNLADARVQK